MTPADRIRAAVAERTWGHPPDTIDTIAAAVCEALAETVAPADFRSRRQTNINRQILAIAADLRGEVET